MWTARIAGRPARFRLWGIVNQNFLMRDERTGSWWQQVSGEAIRGPMRGRRLRQVPHDELSFALFKREFPQGRVLGPSGRREGREWEREIARLPLVVPPDPGAPLEPRALVHGVTMGDRARAYPADLLAAGEVVEDDLGGVPLVLAVAEDGRSVRGFDRRLDGQTLELAVDPDRRAAMIDAATGSHWEFTGRAIDGPLRGRTLTRLTLLTDYWFDWKLYHPQTSVWSESGSATRTSGHRPTAEP